MLPFSDFTYNTMNVVINADKESNLYVANTTGLGGFNASGGNNVQTITTPPKPQNDPTQGYWASPAYWKYTSGSTINYMLYHSATMQSTAAGVAPEAINGYKLLTSGPSGPIPTTYASTNILFCDYSPTPSVSSSGTAATTGIVWAIEHQNQDNPSVPDCNGNYIPHAALHAFNATNMAKLYNSRSVTTDIGPVTTFSTPMIFKGQVYMGTQTEVDVFGLCNTAPSGHCMQ